MSHSRALAAAIPDARLEVLPAGHIVIQELAGDVARLLTGTSTRIDEPRRQHEELDPATKARWLAYGRPSEDRPDVFATLIGLRVEDVRRDYCRLRLVYRPELMQAGGVMHGGAIASLLDSVLVPAIGSSLPEGSRYATVDLHVQFMEGVVDVRRRRRGLGGAPRAGASCSARPRPGRRRPVGSARRRCSPTPCRRAGT